ncbi:hypothetical protein [Amycolatopsis rifamycinica]|uniref:Uncharacterized protein n=1 Tax=Amycolatopsis rifamycinica TaxID=287986 RepID=A0A066TZ41_9PSEU|nr:hypothetical protein [Amycolatopsis rifamycinica]KDN17223.1 hypothetical protein DV20_36945 [Amycolatopsis rifamycinica]
MSTIIATRVPRPPLTGWRYHRATAFSTRLADAHGLPALADIAIAPPRPSRPEAHALLTATLDRWPGLTLAAAPAGPGICLLGDRSGETALAEVVPAELAAVAGYLWLTTGRRLGALEPVRAVGFGTAGHQCELVVVAGGFWLGLGGSSPSHPGRRG